ncbi:phage head closure protein [Clostridium sp. 1001270J_160509_D11]|uniref:phage head closure protein n=1 Tax=Clostridium sp. 1001270J_160509_D11 TaxID=2787103 RepID=UPI0018ABC448|nr:phage head closure protein [Clostridium sp. 1001270J_160509_D11]
MNEIIELISFKNEVNKVGNTIKVKRYKRIFANKKSITQNEFYQAERVGLKPKLRFEIYAVEYEDELLARYKDNEYKIIRTYKTGTDKIELILEGVE